MCGGKQFKKCKQARADCKWMDSKSWRNITSIKKLGNINHVHRQMSITPDSKQIGKDLCLMLRSGVKNVYVSEYVARAWQCQASMLTMSAGIKSAMRATPRRMRSLGDSNSKKGRAIDGRITDWIRKQKVTHWDSGGGLYTMSGVFSRKITVGWSPDAMYKGFPVEVKSKDRIDLSTIRKSLLVHLRQVAVYQIASGTNPSKAFIAFIGRDDGKLIVFEVSPNNSHDAISLWRSWESTIEPYGPTLDLLEQFRNHTIKFSDLKTVNLFNKCCQKLKCPDKVKCNRGLKCGFCHCVIPDEESESEIDLGIESDTDPGNYDLDICPYYSELPSSSETPSNYIKDLELDHEEYDDMFDQLYEKLI